MDVTVTADTESAFYLANLTLAGGGGGRLPIVDGGDKWSMGLLKGATPGDGEMKDAMPEVCVPQGWSAGTETGIIIFWAVAQ